MATLVHDNTITLSGDVGGTKTRLQLTQFTTNADPLILARTEYQNREFAQFVDIIADFTTAHPTKIDSTCIAVAGPIIEGVVKVTNLPWFFSEYDVAELLHNTAVKFINDFEAVGYGIPLLTADDLHTLQHGKPQPDALAAIIGAGTGLGVSLLQQKNGKTAVIHTEGGHVDFAPSDDLQQELLAHLRRRFHRVSNERVVSGIGIENIYKFFLTTSAYAECEHPKLRHLSHFSNNFAADITHYALEHNDPIALSTVDTFIKCYGTVAGNLALTTLPYAGLYIAGGIAPKLLSQMQDGRFIHAFRDKGRMSDLLLDIPIHIILNTHVGLIGAAYYATTLEKIQ